MGATLAAPSAPASGRSAGEGAPALKQSSVPPGPDHQPIPLLASGPSAPASAPPPARREGSYTLQYARATTATTPPPRAARRPPGCTAFDYVTARRRRLQLPL